MQDAFAHCEALVRAADKDRFLSALFAPAQLRGALFALYAFNLEIARVREAAREPLPGEIRLQWWIDVLAGAARGEVQAHPVAAALLATVTTHALARQRLTNLVETRRFDLYDEPMVRVAELESYAEGVSSNLFALAAQVLGGRDSGEIAAIARHAGLAHGLAGLLKAFPIHAARGQLFVPVEILEGYGSGRHDVAGGQATPQLRAALAELRGLARRSLAAVGKSVGTVASGVLPALLPLAVVGPTLARMERPDYDPFVPFEIPQWRRQWLIWRAAGRPSRMFA